MMIRKIALQAMTPLMIVALLAGCGPNNVETAAVEPVVVSQTESAATEQVAVTTVSDEAASDEAESDEIVRPDGWSEATHSNDADPNFEVVFPQDKVNEITITISPEDWAAMQANMTELYGEPNQERDQGGPGGMPPGERPEGGEMPAGGRPGGMGGDFTSENPMWVAATLEFEGNVWTNVGVRYKGNSSLMSGWNSGSAKLPFKLDFDEFEDEYPEIDNQRFYGFKQLSLANGFSDNSFMRDAVTYDLLEEAGLVAAETAWYEITLDYGEGPVNLGLYVAIEVIDDTVVDRYFDGDKGNIYEGDGSATSLAEGTFDQIAASFEKENNEDDADWSDIEALYTILHDDDLRTSDAAAWRAELEEVFDVDSFLEWLAISAVIEHWDTYGGMTHNFYLYNDPATGKLTWISWDHNQTMSSGGMGGGFGRPGDMGQIERPEPPAGNTGNMPAEGAEADAPNREAGRGGGMQRSVSLDKADVTDSWPLIRYLLDQPEYYARYISYMEATINELFVPAEMEATYTQMAAVIEPYASADVGEQVFADAVQQLIDYVQTRSDAVKSFLGEQ